MTSWYGVGSALEELKNTAPDEYEALKEALKTDTFIRYVFTNVDTSLAATDEEIFQLYLDLVEDQQIKERFGGLIAKELSLTRQHLENLLDKSIIERRKNHYYSNLLRASLMKTLHEKQVSLLRSWRYMKAEGSENMEAIQVELLLTINALSGAMRNTG